MAGGSFGAGFVGSSAAKTAITSFASGAAIGGVAGGIGAYSTAIKNDINPWSGIKNNSVTIGEGMYDRVNPVAKDLGSQTISEPWKNNFGDSKVPLQEGLDFNEQWFNSQIKQNSTIYNTGSVGNNSPYYDLELNIIKTTNYQNTYNVNYYQFQYNNISLRFIYIR